MWSTITYLSLMKLIVSWLNSFRQESGIYAKSQVTSSRSKSKGMTSKMSNVRDNTNNRKPKYQKDKNQECSTKFVKYNTKKSTILCVQLRTHILISAEFSENIVCTEGLIVDQNKEFGAEYVPQGVSWSAFLYVPEPPYQFPQVN